MMLFWSFFFLLEREKGWLFVLSFVHFLMFPFVIYYSLARFWVNNIFTIAYMIIMTGTNGYLISDCYKVSSLMVHTKRSKHYGQLFMNAALYVGVYVAISTPYWLMPLAEAAGVQMMNMTMN